MKRKLGFLVAVGGILFVVVVGLRFLGSRGSKQGILMVNSTPTASVFLNDKHLGRTPYEEKVDKGDYSLKLVPETTVTSLASWQRSIKVAPGILTFVNANLSESEFTSAVDIVWLEKITSKSSEIAITTDPDAASVAIGGELKGITPLSLPNITPGAYTMMITSPGYATRTVRVKTTAGYKVNTVVKLALSSGSGEPKEVTPTPSVESDGETTSKPTPTKATSVNPPKPYALVKDTPTGFLRVRLEPTTAASEAGRVNPGDKFTILDTAQDSKENSWYQIKYDGKNTGWISAQYTEKVE